MAARSFERTPKWLIKLALLSTILCIPTAIFAIPITFSASGSDAASIAATVDAFRTALGNPNNGNAVGTQAGGRREINWDGGGAAALATLFPSPMITFNSGATTRGAVFTTAGTGFEISGMPSPEFGDINPTYPDIFQTFSAPRLFSPLGSNVSDVLFFVSGTTFPATVSGFGAVFTDVDLASTTSLQFFDASNASLGTFFAPTSNNGLSFLGVAFTTERVSRVRITSGNTPLGPNDSGAVDVVALDDFLYSEPQPAPELPTIFLLATGMVALTLWSRAKRQKWLKVTSLR